MASRSVHHRRAASASRWQVAHTSACWPVLIWSSTSSASRFRSVRRSSMRRCRAATSRTRWWAAWSVGITSPVARYRSRNAPTSFVPAYRVLNAPGRGVEAVARVGEPLPRPTRRFRGVDPPDLGAHTDASTAKADGPRVGQRRPVAGGKVRHRRRRASATQCPRSLCGAAPRRSTHHPTRRA